MKLPRYVVARKRSAEIVYYWQVPAKQRYQHTSGEVWPTGLVRLPADPMDMRVQAATLNHQLDTLKDNADISTRKGTLPWLVTEYEKSSYFTSLRDRTKQSYAQLSRYVLRWSDSKGNPPINGLTTQKILEFLNQYDTRKSLRDHIATYLAVILEYARRTGQIGTNPARRLGLKRAKRLKPIRTITVDQLLTLVNKAREMKLDHVAIGALLHFDLGQRQGDVLRLQKPRDYRDGVFRFKQSKTDQIVTIRPFLKETREALDTLPADQMMLVSMNKTAVNPATYVRDFRIVANACGYHDLWEMELRHSCVIYCERAGLTPGEIATRTGHGLASVIMILENYRYRDEVVAHQGAIKLEDYRNKTLSK